MKLWLFSLKIDLCYMRKKVKQKSEAVPKWNQLFVLGWMKGFDWTQNEKLRFLLSRKLNITRYFISWCYFEAYPNACHWWATIGWNGPWVVCLGKIFLVFPVFLACFSMPQQQHVGVLVKRCRSHRKMKTRETFTVLFRLAKQIIYFVAWSNQGLKATSLQWSY